MKTTRGSAGGFLRFYLNFCFPLPVLDPVAVESRLRVASCVNAGYNRKPFGTDLDVSRLWQDSHTPRWTKKQALLLFLPVYAIMQLENHLFFIIKTERKR